MTSGEVIVNGFDLCKEATSAQTNLGVCYQHDTLYGNMTVLEHLIFFAKVTAMFRSCRICFTHNRFQPINEISNANGMYRAKFKPCI